MRRVRAGSALPVNTQRLRRFAPLRFAPLTLAPLTLAPLTLAPLRLAPLWHAQVGAAAVGHIGAADRRGEQDLLKRPGFSVEPKREIAFFVFPNSARPQRRIPTPSQQRLPFPCLTYSHQDDLISSPMHYKY